MENIRESFVNIDTVAKVNRLATNKTGFKDEFLVYEFHIGEAMSELEDNLVYNIPLKTVFGKKYNMAFLFFSKSALLLTLIANGSTKDIMPFREGELPFGYTRVNLREPEGDVEIVLSYSNISTHLPTLFREPIDQFGTVHGRETPTIIFPLAVWFIIAWCLVYMLYNRHKTLYWFYHPHSAPFYD